LWELPHSERVTSIESRRFQICDVPARTAYHFL